jgi:pilus assembly protein CpaF
MSFLSKQMKDKPSKDGDPQKPGIQKKPPPQAAKPKKSGGARAALAASSKEGGSISGNYDDGETLDTGYFVPPKRRTTPTTKKLRKQLRPKLLATIDEADQWGRHDKEKQDIIIGRLEKMLKQIVWELSPPEYEELKQSLLDDLIGFGSIQPLIDDSSYTEIMVNGGEVIFGEQKGKLKETEFVFDEEPHVVWTAKRIARSVGRILDRAHPMVDARLPDGSRVHLITAPSALNGTTITIRKFPEGRLTVEDLIGFGSFTPDSAKFMEACVASRLNIVVSGGTGSGKTTLLNRLYRE